MQALASVASTTGICRAGAVTTNQSLSGSIGVGARFGGADAGGGAAVITSEFIGAFASDSADGFAVAAALAADGATTGAEVTAFGTVLIPGGGSGFAAG
jgi:hypothetical protein